MALLSHLQSNDLQYPDLHYRSDCGKQYQEELAVVLTMLNWDKAEIRYANVTQGKCSLFSKAEADLGTISRTRRYCNQPWKGGEWPAA